MPSETAISKLLTPEELELDEKRRELAQLETNLADAELELATLKADLRAFERHYLQTVGRRYAELDEWEAKIAAAMAEREPKNDDLRQRAERARETARASAQQSQAEPDGAAASFTPSDEFKALYRQAAMLMHPDLATDDADRQRRAKAMIQVNDAFAKGDEAALRRLIADWTAAPESVKGEGIAADLVRTIRKIHQIRRRLDEVQKEKASLATNQLWELKSQVETARSAGRDLLNEMSIELDALITDARRRWHVSK